MAKTALELDIKNIVLVAMWSNYPSGGIQEERSAGSDIASSQQAFVNGMNRTLKAMATGNRQVWIVEQVPRVKHDVPQALALGRRFGREVDEIELSLEDHEEQQVFVRGVFDSFAGNANVHRLDPSKLLCHGTSCQVMVDGHSLYSDDDHLSGFGARWVSETFAPVFNSPAVDSPKGQ